MKKEIKEMAIADAIVLAVLGLFALTSSNNKTSDVMMLIGCGFLFIAVTNSFFGVCLLIFSTVSSRKSAGRYGAAMLLIAGVSLLCSLTFCSLGLRNGFL